MKNLKFILAAIVHLVFLAHPALAFQDPTTGQFLSREPLGEAQSLNLYSYCHNDPVNKVDRLGLDEVTVNDGNARYNFVEEVNGARGGWLKKALDYAFLAKFDGSERKFTGSVGLGPVSGGMVSLPGGASIPLSDLQTMADGRAMGHLGQAERMQLLTGDINGWLSRNEGAGGSKLVGTLDKIISSPFQALAGPDSLTILTGIADKHDGFSFGVDLGSRNYARGIHLGTEIDDGIQIASIPLLLNPKNAGTLVRGARALEIGGELSMFRRTSNFGSLADLPVLMNKKTVLRLADEAGIGLDGVKVSINRQSELFGRGLFGQASRGNRITLYPDAFSSPENLIRTLGHERMHLMQFRVHGIENVKFGGSRSLFEDAAFGIEDDFVKFWELNRGY